MLSDKLVEHHARHWLKQLSGLACGSVQPIPADGFAKNREFLRQYCHLEAKPLQKLASEDEAATLDALVRIFERHAPTVLLPFERPYCLQAEVIDIPRFIRSVWAANGSKDITVFFNAAGATLDLQDREDGLYLFAAG